MTQKWNLQDIRPVEPRRKTVRAEAEQVYQTPRTTPQPREDIGTIVIENGKKKNRFKLFLGIGLAIVLAAGAILISLFLAETVLTVRPEFRQPNVNAEFTAYPDRRSNALTYEVMKLEASGERQVSAKGQVEVKEQARGFIEIIKSTPGAERLIKNTRFQSANGLIFRIQESVVVPGAIADSSGALVPGTIRAEVFADSVGEAYNLPAGTRFTVPGFSEGGFTDLYNAIYAENREPFSGGFDGQQYQIEESELSLARQEMQLELRNQLLERVKNERPADHVVFDSAVSFTYTALPAVSYGQDLVTIKEVAVLQIPIFKKSEFAAFLAQQTIPTYNGAAVRIDDVNGSLTFKYTDPATEAAVLANLPSLTFSLVGRPLIIWEYDADQLRQDLAGKPKTAIATVLTGYTGVLKGAQVSVKPFWRQSFPEDPEKITIIEELSE